MHYNIFSVLNCAKNTFTAINYTLIKNYKILIKFSKKLILLTFYLQEFKLTLDRIPKFAHIGDKTKNGKYARH